MCTQCESGFVENSYDATICGDCAVEVGPVDAPVHCLLEEYSSTRAVPPYTTSDTEVDWRDWDVVERMMDQGVCGSCYAFSTIAAAESAYAIMTGKLYKLSE